MNCAGYRDALRREIEGAVGHRPRKCLCDALMAAGVPAAPGAFAQPHAAHREMVVARDGYMGIGLSVRLHDTPGSSGANPRPFNSDAVFILQSLGFNAVEIEQLFANGVVPEPKLGAEPATQALAI